MRPSPPAGVLPVDKPAGPTSHDVVAAARRALGTRRIGHTGTLDPFATGLLLLCVGSATRLAEYLSGLDKSYSAVATLGSVTATDDVEGEVLESSEAWRELGRSRVEAAFARQTGELLQVPPAFSAKKVGGEPLYRKARRGEEVRPEPARVEVYRLVVTDYRPPDVAFDVFCSSGTYIRSIARDAGRELGCGAHLKALRRTAIGPHRVESAVPLARLEEGAAVAAAWLTPLAALAHLPQVAAGEDDVRRLVHGVAVTAPDSAPEHGTVAIAAAGELVAIARAEQGWLRPRKVFQSAD